jgi:hypothetical protein
MSQHLLRLLIVALIAAGPARAAPERAMFLDLARKGWVYDLRSAMWGRDPASVETRINSRVLSGASLCVVGEPPHRETLAVLEAFTALLAEVYDKPTRMRFAGSDLASCGTGRTVFLRLYSGAVPLEAFNSDLRRIDEVFDIRLPRDRLLYVVSPAQAATFFGREGQATHVIVKQAATGDTSALARQFFASILIEELYQAFTFGMDILHLDLRDAFVSKLEEFPVNLRHVPWDSPLFMENLLRSNPTGLCRFDLFMLHALAGARVENTNTPEFLDFIDAHFETLLTKADLTAARMDYAAIVDPACGALD